MKADFWFSRLCLKFEYALALPAENAIHHRHCTFPTSKNSIFNDGVIELDSSPSWTWSVDTTRIIER